MPLNKGSRDSLASVAPTPKFEADTKLLPGPAARNASYCTCCHRFCFCEVSGDDGKLKRSSFFIGILPYWTWKKGASEHEVQTDGHHDHYSATDFRQTFWSGSGSSILIPRCSCGVGKVWRTCSVGQLSLPHSRAICDFLGSRGLFACGTCVSCQCKWV
jgi:hypothetical protein